MIDEDEATANERRYVAEAVGRARAIKSGLAKCGCRIERLCSYHEGWLDALDAFEQEYG